MADAKGGDSSARTALLLEEFVTSLRRRKVEGSLDTAKRTALLMRHVIADARTPNPADLIAAVRAAGVRLSEACSTGAGPLRRQTLAQPTAPAPTLALGGGREQRLSAAHERNAALRRAGRPSRPLVLSLGFSRRA